MSSLTVTAIQTNLNWENKAANLLKIEKKINALKERTEVIVLPEMFNTGFSMQPELLSETMEGETMQWMKEISAANKIILTGSLIIRDDGNFYNRLVWMLPNGQCGYYDKRHLFAYGEEDKHFTAGNKRLIASVKGWKINLLVCYDLRFPVWARNRVLPAEMSLEENPAARPVNYEFDVLIYVANWPEKRSHAWKTLLCARAIENQCYVIGVNRSGTDGNDIGYDGDSLAIDPLGKILYHLKGKEDVFTVTLQKDHLDEVRARFPFWRDADNFTLH